MIFEQLYTCELFEIPAECMARLNLLYPKIQKLEDLYITDGGVPFVVSRCFSTWAQHKAVYAKLQMPVKIHSKHLTGDAIDLNDHDQKIKIWIGKNTSIVERQDVNLYLEVFKSTPIHVHLQQIAPASGNRFFFP